MFKDLSKFNKDLIFIIVSFLLFAGLSGLIIYSIFFLIEKVDAALNIETGVSRQIQGIDFEGLKKIGIIKEQ